MKKLMIAMVTAAFVLMAMGAVAAAEKTEQVRQAADECFPDIVFQDVSEDDWFASAVQYAAENELMRGEPVGITMYH